MWPNRCLRDIVNLVSRQRRKDWHSVRKGACVWIFRRREGAARQTLSPGDSADPGLASVRGLDWLGPHQRREGFVHVHQTHRHAAGYVERRRPARGSLPGRPTDAEERRSAESREEADLCGPCKRDQREKERSDLAVRRGSWGYPTPSSSRPTGPKQSASMRRSNPRTHAAKRARLRIAIRRLSRQRCRPGTHPSRWQPVPAGPSAPRGGSKLAQVIELLQRDHGATIDELIAATGWLAHTTRAALTGLRKRGYVVAIDRSDNERGSFYRIIAEGDGGPVGRPSEEPANSPTSRKPAQRISKPRARRAA